MKKILISIVALCVLSTSAFGEVFLNFSTFLNGGLHEQDSVSTKYGNGEIGNFCQGVYGEAFSTLSDSFGIGLRGGVKWDKNADLTYKDEVYEVDYAGFYVAPSIGWANEGNATKKKINVFPLIFESIYLDDVRDNDLPAEGIDDFNLINLKYGASFSWQWGEGIAQNGFEIGFNIDWTSILRCDDKKVADDGSGFDFWIGYKISIVPGKRSK